MSRQTKATIPMSTISTVSSKNKRNVGPSQGTQESVKTGPQGIFDLANVESEAEIQQQTNPNVLELRPVNKEAIYSNADRDRDISKMKKYFETDLNPMQRLASEPNGARLIRTFVLDKESIHQH